jgi:hypothetical protein
MNTGTIMMHMHMIIITNMSINTTMRTTTPAVTRTTMARGRRMRTHRA